MTRSGVTVIAVLSGMPAISKTDALSVLNRTVGNGAADTIDAGEGNDIVDGGAGMMTALTPVKEIMRCTAWSR